MWSETIWFFVLHQELAGVGGAQIPPNQPGLATVSLDELTVQPDFCYDDSELSDENTGSDSLVQSTLPQRSEQFTVNYKDV